MIQKKKELLGEIDKTKSKNKKQKSEDQYKTNCIDLDKLNDFVSQRVDNLETVFERLVEGYHQQ